MLLTLVLMGLAAIAVMADKSPRERAEALLAQMTTEEKIHMLHGTVLRKDNYVGFVAQNERLGIPALRLNDGPQGFRDEEHPGSTTAWPSGLTVASTFDNKLAYLWGEAMGDEFAGKGANVFLGPGMNVARVPVNGRNFEYSSGGDPYLGYSLVGDVVRGVQDQGIIANAKHWVNNNQETNRGTVDSHVDERTQHEIYYTPFEGAIEAGVGSFMCSYNKINGFWSCENSETLGDLKGTLGFKDGWVMSDWGATHSTSINQGLDQEMPSSAYMGKALAKALEQGTVSMDAVDDSVLRILTPMYAIGVMDEGTPRGDKEADVTSSEHTALAAEISAAGHVLLKNEDNTLPLSKDKPMKIAVIGHMARQPIIGGGGSGQVFPKETISPFVGISAALGVPSDSMSVNCSQTHKDYGYEQPSCIAGMKMTSPDKCSALCAASDNCYYWSFEGNRCMFTPTKKGVKPLPGGVGGKCERIAPAARWACSPSSSCVAVSDAQGGNLAEAEKLVREADVAIVVIGTSSGEGHDREDLTFGRPTDLCQLEPEESQDELVSLVAKVAKESGVKTKVVVAMAAPGAVLTPWRDEVDAIFHGFMPGQAYGQGLASVLFGDVNPSGRLPLTMPNKENEIGFTQEQYPGIDKTVVYTEGLEVDYRWYNAHGVTPAYPFGHGLSYTTFDYSGLSAEKNTRDNTVRVTVTVTNSGEVEGREVPQLYLTFPPTAQEPPLHLKGFRRTELLSPGASTIVDYVLRERDMSVWDTVTHGWRVVKGEYKISLGGSSADLRDAISLQL